ncbi:MAG: NAD(P)/FAD-dependent oxidoreductase [Anaerolineae bacterium]|nr:NAD(P)/FAD-dependent oxidoreductase [Anaerolineae bacterium]
MTVSYDAVIIGGGHNGLVTAAYLAKAGFSVLVIEKREVLGGAASTEEIFPGFQFNQGSSNAGLFAPKIIADLDLLNHGLDLIGSSVSAYSLLPSGNSLTLWRDLEKTKSEIARFSTKDASRYFLYLETLKHLTKALRQLMLISPPSLFDPSAKELLPWLSTALKIRNQGGKEMMELLRILPMTAEEFLQEWFDSAELKGLLAAPGISGSMQGPKASGTAFMLLYHQLGNSNSGFRSSQIVRGGTGRLSRSIAQAAEQYGAKIITGSSVEKIILSNGQAQGILLESGEEIKATFVVSNLDPRHTLFNLVGPASLEPRTMRRVRNIRFRGSTAKLNLALSGLPSFQSNPTTEHLSGHLIVAPSIDYLERAYDDAKYGHISSHPYLDITIPSILDNTIAPPGQHYMSIDMQFAPYHLKDTNWEEQENHISEKIITTLELYAPNIRDIILHQQMITPQRLETEFGLTEGHIYHGQMGLDQLLFMRPIAGSGQYQTPIPNLYLCGSGTHPGGGVTGAPGYNAAKELIRQKT